MHNETFSILIPAILSLVVISTIILNWFATLALVSFSRYLTNTHPEIRNNIGVIKGTRLFISQMSSTDTFVSRISKTYSDTFILIRHFGSKVDIESFYQNVTDIKAVRLTNDTVLISKWESFLLRASLYIKGIIFSLLIIFSFTIIYYIYNGFNYVKDILIL